MIVEIPGEITFSRTYNIPPIPVRLPLIARARTFGQAAVTAIAWCLMMPTLVLFVMLLWHAAVAADPGGSALVLCALAFMLLCFMPQALFGLEDFTRAGPTLIVDADGVTDGRSGRTIRWTDVASARLVRGKAASVRLSLRTPVPPRLLFDRGGTGLLGRRAPDAYNIDITHLDVRQHVLGQTMLARVVAHGGRVER
jgi:hypothetical protein